MLLERREARHYRKSFWLLCGAVGLFSARRR